MPNHSFIGQLQTGNALKNSPEHLLDECFEVMQLVDDVQGDGCPGVNMGLDLLVQLLLNIRVEGQAVKVSQECRSCLEQEIIIR